MLGSAVTGPDPTRRMGCWVHARRSRWRPAARTRPGRPHRVRRAALARPARLGAAGRVRRDDVGIAFVPVDVRARGAGRPRSSLVVGAVVLVATAPRVEVRGRRRCAPAARTSRCDLLGDVVGAGRRGRAGRARARASTPAPTCACAAGSTPRSGSSCVDPQDPTPYWIVSTRHPDALAARSPPSRCTPEGRPPGRAGRPALRSVVRGRCERVRRRTPSRRGDRRARRRAGCGGAPGSSSSR